MQHQHIFTAQPEPSMTACPQVVTPAMEILEGSPEGQQDAARRTLMQQGVQILTGLRVAGLGPAVAGSEAGSSDADGAGADDTSCTVQLESCEAGTSSEMHADLVLWTAGGDLFMIAGF